MSCGDLSGYRLRHLLSQSLITIFHINTVCSSQDPRCQSNSLRTFIFKCKVLMERLIHLFATKQQQKCICTTLLGTPCLYWVGSLFAFRTASVFHGTDCTRCWKQSLEMLVHICMIASQNCCSCISHFTASQRLDAAETA